VCERCNYDHYLWRLEEMLEDPKYIHAHDWLNTAVAVLRKNKHVTLDDIIRISVVHTSVHKSHNRE
jgi:hypothetical protein